jgi:hypothetical protein
MKAMAGFRGPSRLGERESRHRVSPVDAEFRGSPEETPEMKTIHLLSTAAAALLLTAGTASAQNPNKLGAEPAPPAIQNAPAEKIAPPMNAGERKRPETTGQASEKLELGRGGNMELKGTVGAGGRADDSGAKVGAESDVKAGAKTRAGSDTKAGADVKAGDKSEGNASSSSSAQSSGESGSTQKSGQSATGQSTTTTGQGAAAGTAKLSSEQRSQITTIIQKEKVARVRAADLNVSIRVGARIPSHVHVYPLPARVVEIYPAWQGYDFILVGSQILIIDPGTHEIVAILVA